MEWYWWVVSGAGVIALIWVFIKIGLFRVLGEILEAILD